MTILNWIRIAKISELLNTSLLGWSQGVSHICQKIRKRKYVHKQAKMESRRNVTCSKNDKKIKKRSRHQHNTDDGGLLSKYYIVLANGPLALSSGTNPSVFPLDLVFFYFI